jgi:nucleotide-binding universal stress UspA family protein
VGETEQRQADDDMTLDEAVPIPRNQVDDPLLGAGGTYTIGFDGSPASRGALAWAAARARTSSAPLRLIGVADDDAGGMGAEYAEESARRLAGLLSAAGDDFEETHPGLVVNTVLVRGEVATELAQAAGPDDLVVIGSDKTGYAVGRLYGFRSLQVAAAPARRVAVIPSVNLALRAGVVVGVEAIPTMVDLVRIGAREAALHRCPLTLLHAVPMAADAARNVRADEVLTEARAAALQESPEIEVVSHLAHRPAADALLNLSRDSALLLLGRSRSTSPLGVGGTLHDVLVNANAPTIVIS